MITRNVDDVKRKIVNLGDLNPRDISSDLSVYERVRIRRVSAMPNKCRCPLCRKRVRRHDTYQREFFDIGLEETVLVVATVGLYQCPCGNCFTAELLEVPEKGDYSYRVREKALESLVNDSMTIHQTRERLCRNFHVVVSIGTLHGWHMGSGLGIDMRKYEQWAGEKFSGVVCIDEVYEESCCVLVATDPLNDIPIAYVIGEKSDRCTQDDVRKLLGKSKAILPRAPEVVITDGSSLYERLIKETWPKAHHQLCYFHVVKDICAEVLKGVKDLREGVDSKVCLIKEELEGKYAKSAKRAGIDVGAVGSDKALLAQRRYLLVKHERRLSKFERVILNAMMEAYPSLRNYRQFMSDVYNIFVRGTTKRKAWARRKKLVENVVYQGYSRLVAAMKKLRKTVFRKLVSYLGYTNVPRTNNHVEGFNRTFRKMQKTCYKRRVKETIRAALNHVLVYKARKHPLYDGSYGPAIMVPERGTC